MQGKTDHKFWKVLPIVIAAAALGVAGYQQFAIWRLERQLTAMLTAPPAETNADVEEQVRKLEAKVARLAPQCADRSGNAAAPQPAPNPSAVERTGADSPSTGETNDPASDNANKVTVSERLATREGRTQWLAELAEATELTSAQTGALETILSDEARGRDELKAQKANGASVKTMLASLKQLRLESDRKVRGILDDERFKLYQAHRLGVATPAAL